MTFTILSVVSVTITVSPILRRLLFAVTATAVAVGFTMSKV